MCLCVNLESIFIVATDYIVLYIAIYSSLYLEYLLYIGIYTPVFMVGKEEN